MKVGRRCVAGAPLGEAHQRTPRLALLPEVETSGVFWEGDITKDEIDMDADAVGDGGRAAQASPSSDMGDDEHLKAAGIRSEVVVQRDSDDDDTREKGDNARILRALFDGKVRA